MKRPSGFPPLPFLMPEESDERSVLASMRAAVQPARRPSPARFRRSCARGVDAMALRLRENARRYLQMLQD